MTKKQNELGQWHCSRCKNWLDASEFHNHARSLNGLSGECKGCDRFPKYGITLEQYQELLAEHNGLCAICNKTEPRGGYSLAIDHCHVSNRVRGLLCSYCNIGLGRFQDDPKLLTAAAAYLVGG